MSAGAKYKEYEDQAKREESFLNYPKPYPLKIDLVRAGFYFLGPGSGNDDDCQCYYCGVRLFNWTKEDDPMKEHEKFRPHCSFIRSLTNPTNTVPPVNTHPPEGAKYNSYPGGESKIINSQTYFEPKPGTVTGNTHPKRNDTSAPFSKHTLYSIGSQNSQMNQSTKMQQYPLEKMSKRMETALVEETITTNLSHKIINTSSLPPNSIQSPAIPDPRSTSLFIANDNGRLHAAHPTSNISSTHQPYTPTSARTEGNKLLATFPVQPQPTHQQPQPTHQQPQPTHQQPQPTYHRPQPTYQQPQPTYQQPQPTYQQPQPTYQQPQPTHQQPQPTHQQPQPTYQQPQPTYHQPQPQPNYTGASATNLFPSSMQTSYQAGPRMSTAPYSTGTQYGQTPYQELDPRPILPHKDIVQTGSQNFTSMHTPYTPNRFYIAPGSNDQQSSNRFPQLLQQPHQSNYESPQSQAYRQQYPQYPNN